MEVVRRSQHAFCKIISQRREVSAYRASDFQSSSQVIFPLETKSHPFRIIQYCRSFRCFLQAFPVRAFAPDGSIERLASALFLGHFSCGMSKNQRSTGKDKVSCEYCTRAAVLAACAFLSGGSLLRAAGSRNADLRSRSRPPLTLTPSPPRRRRWIRIAGIRRRRQSARRRFQ